jgi:hypothetical protein
LTSNNRSIKALKSLVHNNRVVIILWCLVIPWAFIKLNFLTTFPNNYNVFKYSYIHAVNEVTLYGVHPDEHADKNNYGPFFSFLFAPFALLPDSAGLAMWITVLVLLLLYAIRQLPLEDWQKNGILLISVNELLTSAFHVQFNIAVAITIVLTFVYINQRRDFIAPLPILIGAFVKLYSIVGLAFFFLVRDKKRFIAGCVVWTIVIVIVPMVLSSPGFVLNAYQEWYTFLIIKNSEAVGLTTYQDVSIPGLVRRVFAQPSIPNLPFLIAGVGLFALPYLRISQYKEPAYQLLLLASTLMFPIIFSSASEASTYIIVFIGIGVWFVIQPRPYSKVVIGLLVLAMLLGSLNTTDLYPHSFRVFLREYSIKALPCFFIWLRIVYEMSTADFAKYNVPRTVVVAA